MFTYNRCITKVNNLRMRNKKQICFWHSRWNKGERDLASHKLLRVQLAKEGYFHFGKEQVPSQWQFFFLFQMQWGQPTTSFLGILLIIRDKD
jgi:hypothetical protein